MNRLTSFVRSNPAMLTAMAFVVSGAAMAADGDIDTASVVGVITGGLAAIAAIGAAFLGFKYLKKVWSRL